MHYNYDQSLLIAWTLFAVVALRIQFMPNKQTDSTSLQTYILYCSFKTSTSQLRSFLDHVEFNLQFFMQL